MFWLSSSHIWYTTFVMSFCTVSGLVGCVWCTCLLRRVAPFPYIIIACCKMVFWGVIFILYLYLFYTHCFQFLGYFYIWCKKHVLPLACIFWNDFLCRECTMRLCLRVPNCCFGWRGFVYVVRHLRGGEGLGPPPPHPPPSARCLFIGFWRAPPRFWPFLAFFG